MGRSHCLGVNLIIGGVALPPPCPETKPGIRKLTLIVFGISNLLMIVENNARCNAQCAVRKVYFSAQPNKLKLILNFQKYYPIEHIFVPACSSVRTIHFFTFCDFQTLDP